MGESMMFGNKTLETNKFWMTNKIYQVWPWELVTQDTQGTW